MEGERSKLKSALEILEKSAKQISSMASGQVTRIKLEIAGKFDKTVITKEFEIMATTLKQLQESCTPTKIDPKGPSEETFSRQLMEANKKVQKLETDLSTIKSEFREYRVEHDNFKKQAERFEAETLELKDRNAKLTLQFQKQFSDTAEARKQLSQAQQELNSLLGKVQQDYDDLSVEYQKASNTEKIQREQLKENKNTIKIIKNKIIELEGFVRDFHLFEASFQKENSKNLKLLEAKDKEIKDLRKQNTNLETATGEYEKKYAQMNPLLAAKKQEAPTERPKKGEPVKEAGPADEIRLLKQTIMSQDDEIKLLKDMVKSTALQLAVKDSDIKRYKKRGQFESPGSPSQRHHKKSSLPSLNSSTMDYDGFKEPTKMDRLSELSQKFQQVQKKGRVMDKGTQTGAGGQKNAFTQCTTGAKVENGTQVEPQKKGDKGL